jgi:hypothetical protein
MFKGSTFKVGAKRVRKVPKVPVVPIVPLNSRKQNQETPKTLAEFPHRPGDEQERQIRWNQVALFRPRPSFRSF